MRFRSRPYWKAQLSASVSQEHVSLFEAHALGELRLRQALCDVTDP